MQSIKYVKSYTVDSAIFQKIYRKELQFGLESFRLEISPVNWVKYPGGRGTLSGGVDYIYILYPAKSDCTN